MCKVLFTCAEIEVLITLQKLAGWLFEREEEKSAFVK